MLIVLLFIGKVAVAFDNAAMIARTALIIGNAGATGNKALATERLSVIRRRHLCDFGSVSRNGSAKGKMRDEEMFKEPADARRLMKPEHLAKSPLNFRYKDKLV